MNLKLNTGVGILAFVLVGSFYWNDLFRNNDSLPETAITEGGRDLASLQPANAAVVVSNTLAKKLAESEGLDKSQKAQRPSVFDKFAFEELQGRYSLEISSGKVKAFRFDAQANSNPLEIPKAEVFLNSYKNLWVVQFEKIKKINSSVASKEVFELHDSRSHKVGLVVFEKDANGLWQGMEFTQ